MHNDAGRTGLAAGRREVCATPLRERRHAVPRVKMRPYRVCLMVGMPRSAWPLTRARSALARLAILARAASRLT